MFWPILYTHCAAFLSCGRPRFWGSPISSWVSHWSPPCSAFQTASRGADCIKCWAEILKRRSDVGVVIFSVCEEMEWMDVMALKANRWDVSQSSSVETCWAPQGGIHAEHRLQTLPWWKPKFSVATESVWSSGSGMDFKMDLLASDMVAFYSYCYRLTAVFLSFFFASSKPATSPDWGTTLFSLQTPRQF